MRSRIVSMVMVVAMLLLLGGVAPAFSDGYPGLTGGIGFDEVWGRAWMELGVQQVNPNTYEARGMMHARVINDYGLKRLWYEPQCVSFAEVNGKPAATVVAMIVRREGWDQVDYPGQPGEYLKWQFVDGGTPGSSSDSWSIQWYKGGPDGNPGDPWIEYWPSYPTGGCRNFQGSAPDYPVLGNLVIH